MQQCEVRRKAAVVSLQFLAFQFAIELYFCCLMSLGQIQPLLARALLSLKSLGALSVYRRTALCSACVMIALKEFLKGSKRIVSRQPHISAWKGDFHDGTNWERNNIYAKRKSLGQHFLLFYLLSLKRAVILIRGFFFYLTALFSLMSHPRFITIVNCYRNCCEATNLEIAVEVTSLLSDTSPQTRAKGGLQRRTILL